MEPRGLNESYFRFLRARQAFVLGQAERETIEGFIVWEQLRMRSAEFTVVAWE